VRCSALQCVAVWWLIFAQGTFTISDACSDVASLVYTYVAVRCSVLPCVAVCCSVLAHCCTRHIQHQWRVLGRCLSRIRAQIFQWMRHGTHMNEPWYTYECVTAYIWMHHGTHMKAYIWSHCTHMNAPWHASECVMARIWMHDGAYMNEPWNSYKCVMAHVWMSRCTHRHTYEWGMAHIWISRGNNMSLEDSLSGVCFLSPMFLVIPVAHIWMGHGTHIMRHGTHVNESWHTHEPPRLALMRPLSISDVS